MAEHFDKEFKRDHTYRAHYLHHRTFPPRWVQSKEENAYLLKSKRWTVSYQHQEWPKALYHKDFSIDLERAPDIDEFINERSGQVDERALQKAKATRDKQRQRAIRTARNDSDIQKLGKDWMPYHELPAEKKRLAQEVQDNAADTALYGGNSGYDDFEDDDSAPTVMGEKLRGGRRNVAV